MEKNIEINKYNGIIIDEKSYQRIKKKMCKTDDYFSVDELIHFNAIFNATPRENYKKRSETK